MNILAMTAALKRLGGGYLKLGPEWPIKILYAVYLIFSLGIIMCNPRCS